MRGDSGVATVDTASSMVQRFGSTTLGSSTASRDRATNADSLRNVVGGATVGNDVNYVDSRVSYLSLQSGWSGNESNAMFHEYGVQVPAEDVKIERPEKKPESFGEERFAEAERLSKTCEQEMFWNRNNFVVNADELIATLCEKLTGTRSGHYLAVSVTTAALEEFESCQAEVNDSLSCFDLDSLVQIGRSLRVGEGRACRHGADCSRHSLLLATVTERMENDILRRAVAKVVVDISELCAAQGIRGDNPLVVTARRRWNGLNCIHCKVRLEEMNNKIRYNYYIFDPFTGKKKKL